MRSAALADPEKEAAVRAILDDVRARGDEALLEYGRRWDAPDLSALSVPENAIRAAHAACDPALLETMRLAKANIERFHVQQLPKSWFDASRPGVILGQLVQPVSLSLIHI